MEKTVTEAEVVITGRDHKAGGSDKASLRNHLRKDMIKVKEGAMQIPK